MPISTRTSIIREAPGRYETVEVELDDPRQGEVTVKLAASGLCHSDDHVATGDVPVGIYPYAGGHEGAGVVTAVGPDTPGFEAGDHVVFSFLPACGKCEFCARGLSNLCDLGASLLTGARAGDPASFRMHLDGEPVGQQCGISTFSEYTTAAVDSVVKIDKSIPLRAAALVGCGVPTGWGSAVNSAAIRPGDTVIVAGIGGIGANALQGAVHAGATTVIAVDPVPEKQEWAKQFGATHFYENLGEAAEYARSITNGQGADAAILTIGVVRGEHVAEALAAVRKAGTVVVTGLGDITAVGAPIALGDLTLMQKRLQGSLFGESNPRRDIPNLLWMYQAGQLKLDELVTRTYTLDQIADAYDDMHAGRNLRGLVVFD
ncbi:S-(hydroxymethyl)glutathione dehydrogenase/alcohol dehydrogenase [Amycolatopsis bartoniae]|uniref:Putative zinc-type alcohol dehydrogenase AdhD n=1 Tax=Amycolatopsis bartoniae TaxID=941986 RepID=A0A8H9MB43_9PSEU|nr:NDMA-dependent alcohol dehydrogenase [Amycolatopsis bartoniae]MBB2937218.1 S-(hydroxymethyl)glutathione dehydrogenase/alcohol dehydrogenase [Amycolatopsis bartoniae]TVT09498.1 NDMA-dependent alcohol dehydrogenase [Amycolatopsis bartoniae]GHF53339.1 putative zinc-type alcohol dehydrogenase AdhD [Amycolatopsis bartoniae]